MGSDRSLVFNALRSWAKYIETGSYSGMDKATMVKLGTQGDLPTLTREQQEFVYRLQDLADRVLTTGGL
jgi:hypothetical protein